MSYLSVNLNVKTGHPTLTFVECLVYFVRHPCVSWRWRSAVGSGSFQPPAECRGVHWEVESEGSWRQSLDPRNTNRIRHPKWDMYA